MKEKLLLYVLLSFFSIIANGQAISIATLNDGLNESARSGYASVGPIMEALERAGYHRVNCDETRNGYYVNLYAKNTKISRKRSKSHGDKAAYVATTPKATASIAEVLCSGDGTFCQLKVIVYGKNVALKWVDQLKKAGYKCSSSSKVQGHSVWKYKKPGRDTITIWQNLDPQNAYILMVE